MLELDIAAHALRDERRRPRLRRLVEQLEDALPGRDPLLQRTGYATRLRSGWLMLTSAPRNASSSPIVPAPMTTSAIAIDSTTARAERHHQCTTGLDRPLT